MHNRLARLRMKLASTTDPDDRADLQAAIDALEEKLGLSDLPAAPITVGNVTDSMAIAVGTGARATVYIDGRQGKTHDQVLAAYLARLSRHCGSMPLQGVYEQRGVADMLEIDLDRIYTRLATTSTSMRERFASADLATFDAAAYLAAHTGVDVLPAQRRTTFRLEGMSSAERQMGDRAGMGTLPDLDGMDAANLARMAQEATALTFLGPELVTETIATHRRLVVLGEPGSGKSTALRYLALALAMAGLDAQLDPGQRLDGWTAGRLLPVFAPLLPLAQRFAHDPTRQGDATDLWDYLADQLQPKGAHAGLAAAVHEEVEAGRAILLLDGLDEVAGAESRRKVVRAVQAFAEQYQMCRLVVACRIRAYEGERNQAWQMAGWPTATLADWTLAQMQAFVRAWYYAVAELRGRSAAWRDERIAALLRAITTRMDLQRFGRQPLMLTVMALVHLNDGRLPEERASLYGRCIDILLGQWEIGGRDGSEYRTLMEYIGLPDADVQSLRPLLSQAASAAHQSATPGEVGRLSRPVLRTMVDDALKQRGHANPSHGADRFLEYTDLRAGLIHASDAGDAYVFPHQTFQEYLAGLELVGGVDPVAGILALRSDDRWRRPILLGIEHLALSSLAIPHHLLSRLVEEPGREPPQRVFDLLLAQEIAADLGWDWLIQRDPLFASMQQRLAGALANMLGQSSVPARDRVAAGAVLAELGDPRPGVLDLPPAMVDLPGGTFVIGSTPDQAEAAGLAWAQYWFDQGDAETAKEARTWPQDEINDQPLTLARFALARYPVTNAQYALFIDAGGYNPNAPWWDEAARTWLARNDATTEGLQDWQRRDYKDRPEWWDDTDVGIARPNYPLVGVSWYEATAFCRWLTHCLNDGYTYRLPSEAEWEYAARGLERRQYPWGEAEPDGERANYNRLYGSTTAVGCFPPGATAEGMLDLAGNVWEWTRSVYRPYPYDPADGREDAANPARKFFTLRGGGWYDRSIYLRASYRLSGPPDHHYGHVGVRLARHLPV